MFKMIEKMRDREEGFTLVELLVVVVIIAILAAVAIPLLLGQRAKAEDSAAKGNLSAVASVIKNGQAVGEDVDVARSGAGTAADPYVFTVSYAGDGGDQSITLGDAQLEVAGATPADATAIEYTDTWCITQPGGDTNNWQMTNTDTAPVTGTCA